MLWWTTCTIQRSVRILYKRTPLSFCHIANNAVQRTQTLFFHSSRHWKNKLPPEVNAKDPLHSNQHHHQLNPTIIQRLGDIENSLRFHGYSTVRIGLFLAVITGTGLYVFREYIRENVADEVSNVATRSLDDVNVKLKAHELSVALLHAIMDDPNIQQQSVKFLREVFARPDTQQLLVSLLLDVLKDPQTQASLASTLKHVFLTALNDPAFRENLAVNLQILLQDEHTQKGILNLLKYALNDDSVKLEAQVFVQGVLSSDPVKEESLRLGKTVVNGIVDDDVIRKQAGEAMWAAFTYSVKPQWFASRQVPAKPEATDAETDDKLKRD